LNIEKAIRNLGNELAELTGDNYAKIRKLEQNVQNHCIFAKGFREGQQLRIQGLETTLADARRDHTVLVRLVERMGRELCHKALTGHLETTHPYTIIGQREWQAAQHDEEGGPETRESTGAHGYGGPGL